MALIIISKDETGSIINRLESENKRFETFTNADQIQHDFCDEIESDDYLEPSDTDRFLCKPVVAEYLDSIGIRYDATTQSVFSAEWGELGETEGRFVTYLSYYVQAACVMLARDLTNDFIAYSYSAVDPKLSAFVLKRKNVYLVNENTLDAATLLEYLENGVDVVYHGKHFSASEADSAFGDLLDLECCGRNLSRELDAEVFNNYLKSVDTHYPKRESLTRFTADNNAAYEGIDVLTKGKFAFSETFRRYPMHRLYKINGTWYYTPYNSVKYPSVSEIMRESFINTEIECFNVQGSLDVSGATEVFTLVLDCDESCDAKHYWERIAFIGKYNKQLRLITILDKHEGLLEFHELLQHSTDLTHSAEFLN